MFFFLLSWVLRSCSFFQHPLVDDSHPEGQLSDDIDAITYTRMGPIHTKLAGLACLQGGCKSWFIPSGQMKNMGITFHSKVTGVGDEVGWDFIRRVQTCKITFTGFCKEMTQVYQTNNLKSAPFMSPNTFTSWFFGWLSNHQIDFRKKGIDPWCKYEPELLACDGTHIGVAVRHMKDSNFVTVPELPHKLKPIHKRYVMICISIEWESIAIKLHGSCSFFRANRILIPCKFARKYLKLHCKRTLGSLADEDVDEGLQPYWDEALRDLDEATQEFLKLFVSDSFNPQVMTSISTFLLLFCGDSALTSALPFPSHPLILQMCDTILSGHITQEVLQQLRTWSQELVGMVLAAEDQGGLECIVNFLRAVIDRIEHIHGEDRPAPPVEPIPGSYNPPCGTAYYFTEHGHQIRKLPSYDISGKADNCDDLPQVDQLCRKDYPLVSRHGFGYMLLWFCPVHGHCYGFHLIKKGEGRKDPFSSLLKFCPSAPREVFYDFACQLNEYCLNREPSFFKDTRFWHDIFHSFPHKCGPNFRSSRVQGLSGVNSEICEQWNSYLQCIKFTASHLSQEHFMFFMQYLVYLKNEDKSRRFKAMATTVLAGLA